MILICQTIPHRDTGIFRKLFHDLLTKAAVLDTIIHSAKHARGIAYTLFFPDLRTARVQICALHTQIMCCHLKGAACSRTRLFKNERDIFPCAHRFLHACLFFCLIFCGKLKQVSDLLWCIVLQCQKISSF